VTPEVSPSDSHDLADVSIEARVAALESQLKQLQDIVREHFAAPDHQANPEPLRELQEGMKSPATHI
jgi:hypothetical protein